MNVVWHYNLALKPEMIFKKHRHERKRKELGLSRASIMYVSLISFKNSLDAIIL